MAPQGKSGRFSAADVLWIRSHTGARLIFDHQRFWCSNPERLEVAPTIGAILDTWPDAAGRRARHRIFR